MRLFTFYLVFTVLPVWWMIYPGSVLAVSDRDLLVGECKKRTGMNESSCVLLLKKYMTVERCQEYTDFSREQCETKIVALKQTDEFRDAPPQIQNRPDDTKGQSESPVPNGASVDGQTTATTLREKILASKQDKLNSFKRIEDETQALIKYLKNRGQDVTQLEVALVEFTQKKQAVALTYDQYQSLVEAVGQRFPFELSEPRFAVARALQDAAEHYDSVLLVQLKHSLTLVP